MAGRDTKPLKDPSWTEESSGCTGPVASEKYGTAEEGENGFRNKTTILSTVLRETRPTNCKRTTEFIYEVIFKFLAATSFFLI